MSDSRTELKATFSQFIDQLIDGELKTIRDEISRTKKEAADELAELKERTINDITELKDGLEQERTVLSEAKEELEATIKSVQQTVVDIHNDFTKKDATTSQALQNLAVNMAETFTEQDSEYRALTELIENRVRANEDKLAITADDHGKLATVLQMFGNVAAVAPVQSELAPQTTVPPLDTKEPRQHESLPGDSDFLDIETPQEGELVDNFEVDYSEVGNEKKVLGK